MKTSPVVGVLLAWLAAGMLVASQPSAAIAADTVPNQRLLDLMAEGKTETDLGHYDVAIRALSAIVEAPEAPPALRDEALVRLGAARRAAGDFAGALESFQRVAKAPSLDAQTKALLVRHSAGHCRGPTGGRRSGRVSFTVDRSCRSNPPWPSSGPMSLRPRRTAATDHARPNDGKLQDIFRLIADVSGLNVVVNPGVHGQFVVHLQDQPWDLVLDRILSANGLSYQWEDNVLRIARPEELGPPRRFSGRRIDVEYHDTDLRKALAELAAEGGATVTLDSAIAGHLTLKLNQVRWDQALDIVVRVNGLDWARDGKTLKVFPAPALPVK
jgi:hypothetical protein